MTTYYHRYGYSYCDLAETAMSIVADGYSFDATVTLCPRPLQLFQIQAFLLPQQLFKFFLLLPAQPTSTATTSIRAMLSYELLLPYSYHCFCHSSYNSSSC